MERILIIGANGQIGSELTDALAARHGAANVFAADIAPASLHHAERYLQLDVLDRARHRPSGGRRIDHPGLPAGRAAVCDRRADAAQSLVAEHGMA